MKSFFCLACIWIAVLFFSTSSVSADDPRLVIDTGGHKALIRDVIFTSDGRYLVSAADDKVVRVWDVQTGETVRTIRGQIGDGQEGQINAIALSSNDQYLAVARFFGNFTGKNAGTIRIYDFKSGKMTGLLKGHTEVVTTLDFSSDGRHLASGSFDRTVRIWDVEKKRENYILIGHLGSISDIAFSPDGKMLVSSSSGRASGSGHALILWDAEYGTVKKKLEGHESAFEVAFSPDGRYIASSGLDEKRSRDPITGRDFPDFMYKSVRLWDATTGDFIRVLQRQNIQEEDFRVKGLSFSRKNDWLLTGSGFDSGYVCQILSASSGKVVSRFEKHNDIVLAITVSPDGELAATGGGSSFPIYLWNIQNRKITKKLEGKGQQVFSVGFAQDGRSIAFGNQFNKKNDNNRGPLQTVIRVNQDGDYELALGGEVKNESGYLRAVEQYRDDKLTTKKGGAYGYQAILQVIKNGKVLHEIERDSTSGRDHRSYTFTHDGRYIISGGGNGVLILYDTETGKKVHEFVGHTGAVWAVAVSPDNLTVVSGSADQTVRLWDITSGRNLLTVFVGSNQEWVAWTPEGYYTSSLNGDQYIGWQLNKGEDKAAEYYPAAQFQKTFYRPDVVAEYLKTRDIQLAVQQANEERSPRERPVVAAPDIRTILPPFVYVMAPKKEESTVREETLRVKAVGLSRTRTLPVSDVKVFLNGIQVAGRPQGNAKGSPQQREVELEVEVEVTLQKGLNILTVVASHESASSDLVFRRIIYESSKKADKPNLILLAVGISKYEHKDLNLDFADADAQDLVKALEGQQGVLFETVKTRLLSNEKASRTEIIRGLNWLSREGTQKDIRILFLSGHGDLDSQNNYYFLSHGHDPKDDLEMHDIDWSFLLSKLTSAQSKVILMVDTCHAAAAAGKGNKEKRRSNVDFDRILREIRNNYTGVVTFAASTGTEVSVERKEWGHGAFTKALLEGLSGKADGYGGKTDKVIETKELGAWIIDRVKELTGGEQHAIHSQPPELPTFPLFVLK